MPGVGCRRVLGTVSLWVAVLMLGLVLRKYLVITAIARGTSMLDTVQAGDVLLAVRPTWLGRATGLTYARGDSWARNDLVLARLPERMSVGDLRVVKRILGLPGETVEMRAGQLYVNDHTIDEPYARTDSLRLNGASIAMQWQIDYVKRPSMRGFFPTNEDWGPIVVPTDKYFLLGDNRQHSQDSREFGFFASSDLLGRVVGVLVSHSGDCCTPRRLWRGARLERTLRRLH
ncbi:MAG: signal peptidase I [Gemmatimonadaceae bacterium]|nr:signal peptidase I [Gemmatimonadaceae bacterium]